MTDLLTHRHGTHVHAHVHDGPHRHLRWPQRSTAVHHEHDEHDEREQDARGRTRGAPDASSSESPRGDEAARGRPRRQCGRRGSARMPRSPFPCAVALAVVLLMPAAAAAHGLGAVDPNRPLPDYLWLGFKHLLAGWDHLLFILAIVLLAGSLWQATKLISLFVAGHSITLMLATTNEWTVSAQLVDVIIALAVVFVAVVALRGRPHDWTWFGGALLAIGLVHGLGLGTRLLELGVSDNDLAWRVLLFNIGVEFGQATAVLACIAAGWLLTRTWTSSERALRPALTVILLAGGVGAAVLSFPGQDTQSVAMDRGAACTETATTPPPVNDAEHPPRPFYEPDEQPPLDDFTHVMGDGFVVVSYDPQIAAGDLQALRREINTIEKYVVAGPDLDQTVALIAKTAQKKLTCTRVNIAALLAFRDGWIKQVQGQR